jgi:hypothetical protein
VREYAFELGVCANLEATTDWIVARQLGGAVARPGSRVMDVVGVEPGPQPAFDERAAITDRTIPAAAIEADVGVGRAVPVETALEGPPERREEVLEAALEAGFFERERRDGRVRVRQAARYPDGWFGRLVGVENKPDLGTPGDLDRQLRLDAALGLFDAVVLATASHVTGAHLNRIPEAVGVWRVDPDADPDDGDARTVVREPTPLSVAEAGVEPVAEHPLRTDVAIVGPDAKRRKRRRIAERAYGKGWRPDPDGVPDCVALEPTADGRPHCTHFGRVVDPARECGSDCPGYEAATDAGADPASPYERAGVDVRAVRAARTPWVADPDGRARRQTGLDRFR